jgi:hypothetical protein
MFSGFEGEEDQGLGREAAVSWTAAKEKGH